MSAQCEAAATLGDSEWFHLADSAGKRVDTLQAELHKTPSPHGLALSLEVTNTGNQEAEVTLAFPSLTIHVSSDSQDVSYLFPQAVATISSKDAILSADYGPKFLLQFTDVFAPRAGCGAAVIVEDTSGLAKSFVLKKEGDSVKRSNRISYSPCSPPDLLGAAGHGGFAQRRLALRFPCLPTLAEQLV